MVSWIFFRGDCLIMGKNIDYYDGCEATEFKLKQERFAKNCGWLKINRDYIVNSGLHRCSLMFMQKYDAFLVTLIRYPDDVFYFTNEDKKLEFILTHSNLIKPWIYKNE